MRIVLTVVALIVAAIIFYVGVLIWNGFVGANAGGHGLAGMLWLVAVIGVFGWSTLRIWQRPT